MHTNEIANIFRVKSLNFVVISRISTMVPQAEDKCKDKLIPSSNNPINRVTFDNVLSELGEFGLEQKINYFMFSIPYIMSSMMLMGWVFVGSELPHRCRLPDEVGLENVNFTVNDSDWEVDSCSRTY